MTDRSLNDPLVNEVRVDGACRYLVQRGWARKPFPRPGVILFEGPLDDDGVPIIQLVPAAEDAPGYLLRIQELLRGLSVIEDRPAKTILRDIVTGVTVGEMPEDAAWYNFANTILPTVLDEIESRQPRPSKSAAQAQLDVSLKSASDAYDSIDWSNESDRNTLIVTAARVAIALAQEYQPGELVSAVAIRILRMWDFSRRKFSRVEIERINELASKGDELGLCDLFVDTMMSTRRPTTNPPVQASPPVTEERP